MSSVFTSAPIPLAAVARGFQRADLIFHGLDHSGPSYEARIFFNRPDATENTPQTPDQGYVDSFFIFGHGGCAGEPGHCDVPELRRPYDLRPPHQLTPAIRWVTVTEAARRVIDGGGDLTLTVVPVVASLRPRPDADGDPMKLERVTLVTYD